MCYNHFVQLHCVSSVSPYYHHINDEGGDHVTHDQTKLKLEISTRVLELMAIFDSQVNI